MKDLKKKGLKKTGEEAVEIGHQIVNFLPDATFVIDNSGKVIAWNRAIEKMTGVKAKDILGKGNYEYSLAFYEERRPVLIDLVIHPEQEVLAKYAYVRREGESLISETEPEMLKLRDVHLLNVACALYDRDGTVMGAIESIRDITDQKQAAKAVRENDERFQLTFYASPDAINLNRMEDGLWVDINEGFTRLTGYTREDVAGKTSLEINIWHDPGDRRRLVRELAEKGSCENLEAIFRKKNGELGVGLMSARVISIGGIHHIISITREITEIKKAEEKIKSSEAKYRNLFETANDAIFLMEGDIFVDCNRKTLEMFGCTREEIIGKSPDLFSPEFQPDGRNSREKAIQKIEEVLKGNPQFFEWRHCRPDGTLFDTEVSLNYIQIEGRALVQAIVRNITDRKKAEEELARTEEKYRSIVEESFDGIFIHKGSKIVFANRRLQEMLGYSQGELLGMETWSICHPDYRAITAERAQSRLRGEDVPSHYEVKFQRKDGSWFYGETGAKVIAVEGEPGIQVWVKDITERRQAEESARKSEKRFQQLYEATSDAIFTQDIEGRFLSGNRAILDMLGYPLDDLVGRKACDFMKPELVQLFETAYLQKLKDYGHCQGTSAYFAKDGHKFYLEYQSDLIRPDDGEPFISVVARDVTHRVLSERKIREKEESIRAILEANPNPVAVYGTKGKLLYMNPAFTEVFGWAQEEMMQGEVPFVPDDQREITAARIKELYNTGEGGTLETRRLTKDGRLLDVSISAALMRDRQGTPSGMVVNFTDVTERRKLEAQFQQAQKMESVGRLAGGVAHDFNNMLGVILGRAELALLGTEPGSSLERDLLDIQKAAKRSADLTRQLLGFARKQTAAPKVLDLNDTIAGMLKMLRRLIGEDIDLAWLPGAGIQPVKMDPSQLDQILANLCVNARDAINDVGKITIETEDTIISDGYCKERPYAKPGRYVSIIVSDTGCGIGKDVVDKIFEPFFTTKEVGKGTGLGLAMVYGIVKQNQGHINVYSEPGQGTAFNIYLPICGDIAEGETSEADEESIQGGSETVLLVEDEEMLLEMGEMMLKRLGYNVLAALGPRQALEALKGNDKDIALIITDVVMPEMNGMDLVELISSLRPGIKCLFTSGYTANVIAQRGVLKEGVNFIQKPLVFRDLAKKIRSILES